MSVDAARLMDPEFLIPSDEDASNLEFWKRLLELSEDGKLRIGPASLQKFYEFANGDANVGALPERDFWSIVGALAQRGIEVSATSRPLCEEHLRSGYTPHLGHDDNIDLLILDLLSVEPSITISLRTADKCWNDLDVECAECKNSKVFRSIRRSARQSEDDIHAIAARFQFLEKPQDFKQLEKHASTLFPSVVFSDSAWNAIGTLSGSPSDTVAIVVKHLSVLNDSAVDIWQTKTTRTDRQAAMGAVGVTCSPEGPRTHKSAKSMARRDFSFPGCKRRCEWHTKIRPGGDRIYFAVQENAVYVGAIVDHLPL